LILRKKAELLLILSAQVFLFFSEKTLCFHKTVTLENYNTDSKGKKKKKGGNKNG